MDDKYYELSIKLSEIERHMCFLRDMINKYSIHVSGDEFQMNIDKLDECINYYKEIKTLIAGLGITIVYAPPEMMCAHQLPTDVIE